jgi:hypothetical protein
MKWSCRDKVIDNPCCTISSLSPPPPRDQSLSFDKPTPQYVTTYSIPIIQQQKSYNLHRDKAMLQSPTVGPTSWMKISPIEILVTRACEPTLHEPNYVLHLEVAEYINQKKANKLSFFLVLLFFNQFSFLV